MSYKTFDFMGHRNKFFAFSIILTLAGIVCLFVFGMNLGIDFTRGTQVDIKSNHSLSITKVQKEFDELGYHYERPTLSGNNRNIASVRLRNVLNEKQIATLKDRFKDRFNVNPANINVNTVSPQIGRELAKNAFLAIFISSIFMIIYVWIRFEFLQGLAAIIALLHDAFFIITVFSLLHIEVNIEFIAAVLTIVGYSINDTIVTFDRIRENLKLHKKKVKTFDELAAIVNKSIQQTFVRSINTVMTVLIAVVALMIIGSPSIRTFTIALFVGLLVGVYSSIFIASPLWAVMAFKYMSRQKKKAIEQPTS